MRTDGFHNIRPSSQHPISGGLEVAVRPSARLARTRPCSNWRRISSSAETVGATCVHQRNIKRRIIRGGATVTAAFAYRASEKGSLLAVRFDFALHCRLHATLPQHARARRAAIGTALQVMVKPLPQAARISHESNRRRILSCAAIVSATYAHIAASSQRCIESCGANAIATYANQPRIESSGVCNLFDRRRNMCAPGAHRNSAAL